MAFLLKRSQIPEGVEEFWRSQVSKWEADGKLMVWASDGEIGFGAAFERALGLGDDFVALMGLGLAGRLADEADEAFDTERDAASAAALAALVTLTVVIAV
jgi:hypothetical protein